ncbi:hypothetical protein KM043_014871 [Ampulex compressa]|nr:hypothetical protein KM043_014871 [Ampulex compressa]
MPHCGAHRRVYPRLLSFLSCNRSTPSPSPPPPAAQPRPCTFSRAPFVTRPLAHNYQKEGALLLKGPDERARIRLTKEFCASDRIERSSAFRRLIGVAFCARGKLGIDFRGETRPSLDLDRGDIESIVGFKSMVIETVDLRCAWRVMRDPDKVAGLKDIGAAFEM